MGARVQHVNTHPRTQHFAISRRLGEVEGFIVFAEFQISCRDEVYWFVSNTGTRRYSNKVL